MFYPFDFEFVQIIRRVTECTLFGCTLITKVSGTSRVTVLHLSWEFRGSPERGTLRTRIVVTTIPNLVTPIVIHPF